MNGPRNPLALGALALFALAFVPAFSPRQVTKRLERSSDPGFAFDSRYPRFLEAVEQSTPSSATIAILAPETSELYLEQAAYRLAPRRVVGKELSANAPYLAVFRGDTPGVPKPKDAVAVPGGFLLKR